MKLPEDPVLFYDTRDEAKRRLIACGATKGSILGPDDSLLEMEMPDGTHLTGFSDDAALMHQIQIRLLDPNLPSSMHVNYTSKGYSAN